MAKVSLHKVTPNSWIADSGSSPIAYIHKGKNEYTFMTPEVTKTFPSMDAIKNFLGGKVHEQLAEARNEKEVMDDLDGYPVKHQNITVECLGDRPVYLRGKTRHVAGYWALTFGKRWLPTFCPLVKTIEQYNSSGPYKTKVAMMNEITHLNRTDNEI